jgi:hypothetical protein
MESQAVAEALARIEGKLDALLSKPAARTSSASSSKFPAPNVGDIAPDSELDSQYGNPKLKKSPTRWKGRDLAGKSYSELTVEELECVASLCDWKVGKNMEEGTPESDKNADYARKDGARARGWIRRIEAGWKPPTVSDDDIPFSRAA